jgi:hypothetical protein
MVIANRDRPALSFGRLVLMAISWRFDGDDRLCGVGDHWDEFALANNGSGCVPAPIGGDLSDFVSSAELCVVWQAILGLSRREHGRPVTVTYRCDSPSERRLMKATVTSGARGEVEIVSSVGRAETRPAVRLLDPEAADRGSDMIRMCGWCARVLVDDWVDVEEGCRRLHLLELEAGPLPRITHGICGDCVAAVTRDLDLSPGLQPATGGA